MDNKIKDEEKEDSGLDRRQFLKKLALKAVWVPAVIITFKARKAYAAIPGPSGVM